MREEKEIDLVSYDYMIAEMLKPNEKVASRANQISQFFDSSFRHNLMPTKE